MRGGPAGETRTWGQERFWRHEKNGEQNQRAASVSIISSLDSSGSVAMLGPREGGRQSKDDANGKRETLCCHLFAKRNATAFRTHCNIGKVQRLPPITG